MFDAGEFPDPITAGGVQCQFKVGDKVRVDLEADILKAMQEGHGGWNPRMAEVLTVKCKLFAPLYFTPSWESFVSPNFKFDQPQYKLFIL